jgi:hypothetical protein
MIDELETKIFELDFHTDETERTQTSSAERRNQEKRTAYLDTAYLRNGLIGWSAQLLKMVQHAEDLENNVFGSKELPEATGARLDSQPVELPMVSIRHQDGYESKEVENSDNEADSNGWLVVRRKDSPERMKTQMRRASRKIKDRLQAIIDEYEDKIRDCTMRVDGMAMATQWVKTSHNFEKNKANFRTFIQAQGETNVEIALATSRDSRHMRSIALLTMVFLPGTFFAVIKIQCDAQSLLN